MSFFELFNPGLRHLREERERQRVLVANPTHGGGAPLGIDLDGGTARFVVPAPPAPTDQPAGGEEADQDDEPASQAATTAQDQAPRRPQDPASGASPA